MGFGRLVIQCMTPGQRKDKGWVRSLSFYIFLFIIQILICDLKEKFVFWTSHLIIRMFMIKYNVLQHYYEKWCSYESWSSLLTSPLAENNTGEDAFKML